MYPISSNPVFVRPTWNKIWKLYEFTAALLLHFLQTSLPIRYLSNVDISGIEEDCDSELEESDSDVEESDVEESESESDPIVKEGAAGAGSGSGDGGSYFQLASRDEKSAFSCTRVSKYIKKGSKRSHSLRQEKAKEKIATKLFHVACWFPPRPKRDAHFARHAGEDAGAGAGAAIEVAEREAEREEYEKENESHLAKHNLAQFEIGTELMTTTLQFLFFKNKGFYSSIVHELTRKELSGAPDGAHDGDGDDKGDDDDGQRRQRRGRGPPRRRRTKQYRTVQQHMLENVKKKVREWNIVSLLDHFYAEHAFFREAYRTMRTYFLYYSSSSSSSALAPSIRYCVDFRPPLNRLTFRKRNSESSSIEGLTTINSFKKQQYKLFEYSYRALQLIHDWILHHNAVPVQIPHPAANAAANANSSVSSPSLLQYIQQDDRVLSIYVEIVRLLEQKKYTFLREFSYTTFMSTAEGSSASASSSSSSSLYRILLAKEEILYRAFIHHCKLDSLAAAQQEEEEEEKEQEREQERERERADADRGKKEIKKDLKKDKDKDKDKDKVARDGGGGGSGQFKKKVFVPVEFHGVLECVPEGYSHESSLSAKIEVLKQSGVSGKTLLRFMQILHQKHRVVACASSFVYEPELFASQPPVPPVIDEALHDAEFIRESLLQFERKMKKTAAADHRRNGGTGLFRGSTTTSWAFYCNDPDRGQDRDHHGADQHGADQPDDRTKQQRRLEEDIYPDIFIFIKNTTQHLVQYCRQRKSRVCASNEKKQRMFDSFLDKLQATFLFTSSATMASIYKFTSSSTNSSMPKQDLFKIRIQAFTFLLNTIMFEFINPHHKHSNNSNNNNESYHPSITYVTAPSLVQGQVLEEESEFHLSLRNDLLFPFLRRFHRDKTEIVTKSYPAIQAEFEQRQRQRQQQKQGQRPAAIPTTTTTHHRRTPRWRKSTSR